ncbi:MAG TPA: tRNA 2-thiouridine(34) synthase MnmA [Verrucomicrobiae bacterium]|nr:tRNA 2-thiouridine(34) synthase MnmA [Verrucomicrobiae bacterium]
MNPKKQRICVGMSGGVDSSVAAYLLKTQGYDVIGLTFRGWPQDCRSIEEDKCCGPQAVADARMVAHSLDIPYYVVDEVDTFRREVMGYFSAEYQRGRTPNPCVICNEKVKFGSLLRKARTLGAEMIATGHYARITKNGRCELRRARDERKDQTYFLFSLNQDQLARAIFPLGELTKADVRAIAKEIGLKTYGKKESQEVCFVPENDYRRFLRESGVVEKRGEIVTRDGRVHGVHSGIHNFTIGQREGLSLGGLKQPLYVVELEPATNRVIVGSAKELLRSEFEVSDCVWHTIEPSAPLEVMVKLRHQHPGARAFVASLPGNRARVRLPEPQRAITPGQAAVFYRDDVVVGGGWIC